MQIPRRSHPVHRIGLSAAFFLIAGCISGPIPTGNYQLLSESSQSVLQETIETYTRIEDLQQRFAVVTEPADEPLTLQSFEPVVGGESFDLVPELRFREAALTVLVRYTALLSAFAKRDYEREVDRATHELAGSLGVLAKRAGVLHAEKVSGIFGKIVDVIGRTMVRKKRREALKQIMDGAQPDIESLADLLSGSHQRIGRAVDVMAARILVHANARRPPYEDSDRLAYDIAVADLIEEIKAIRKALAELQGATEAIPEAHAEIRARLDERPGSVGGLHLLLQEVQLLDGLYRRSQ